MKDNASSRGPGRQQSGARAARVTIARSRDAVAETGPRNPVTREGTSPSKPRALLVYPELPPSYWGFQYATRAHRQAVGDAAAGAADRSGDVPRPGELRLVDMNVDRAARTRTWTWADLVLTSTMVVQRRSLRDVIARCHRGRQADGGRRAAPDLVLRRDRRRRHLPAGEVEETFPRFLADWEGRAEAPLRPEERPPITLTPVPRFDLLDLDAYSSMALQFSRGLPVQLRVLRHHQALRPGSADQVQRADARRARPPLRARLAGRGLPGRRQLHRQPARGAAPAAGCRRLATRARPTPSTSTPRRASTWPSTSPSWTPWSTRGSRMVFLGIESPNPDGARADPKVAEHRAAATTTISSTPCARSRARGSR